MMFDVIVVGAGSAGAPLAARLSEDGRRRVLLLEAGRDWRAAEQPHEMATPNPYPLMNDPALQARWQWPQLVSRRTRLQAPRHYWRGRGLGGSSMVNAQIAIRGVPDVFDAWAEAGCEGWSADQVLPLFTGLENDPEMAGQPGHATTGPVPIYRAPESSWGPIDIALKNSALAAGYPWNPDLNAATGEGVSTYPINSRGGRRVSTNEAFLEPARHRPNLTIRGEALVDRVLVENGTATGVRVRLAGEGWVEIKAKEVVLCAGAVHSPAILLRSGIGPAAELAALGIGLVRDMPMVGRDFMDHPIVRATIKLRPPHAVTDLDARHTNCCVTYSSGLAGGGRRDMIMIGFNYRGFENGVANPGAIGVALYDAYSRGSVTLASADPERDPAVEENMLDHPDDRLRLRDGIRRLAVLAEQPALRDIATWIRLLDTDLTIGQGAALPDDELDRIMMEQCGDIQHAAGSCKMTAYEDPRGVVDPDLRVKGIKGLSVADASIMPTDCRANLHFTCMMIGEMAAKRLQESMGKA